jgi:hypothetical protein
VSTPEDKKFDFEKLTLSEDLSGSLEPVDNGAPEPLLPEQELKQAEAKTEEMPLEEEEQFEPAEPVATEDEAVPATSKFKGLLEKLKTAHPFNVLLFLTVAALLIAILCCLVELGRYGFHISAKEAKSSVTMSVPVDSVRNIA